MLFIQVCININGKQKYGYFMKGYPRHFIVKLISLDRLSSVQNRYFFMKHIEMNEIIGIFTKFFHSFRRNEFDTAGAVEKSGGRRKVKFLPSLCFQLQI